MLSYDTLEKVCDGLFAWLNGWGMTGEQAEALSRWLVEPRPIMDSRMKKGYIGEAVSE